VFAQTAVRHIEASKDDLEPVTTAMRWPSGGWFTIGKGIAAPLAARSAPLFRRAIGHSGLRQPIGTDGETVR
jgi:hypothetical protein